MKKALLSNHRASGQISKVLAASVSLALAPVACAPEEADSISATAEDAQSLERAQREAPARIWEGAETALYDFVPGADAGLPAGRLKLDIAALHGNVRLLRGTLTAAGQEELPLRGGLIGDTVILVPLGGAALRGSQNHLGDLNGLAPEGPRGLWAATRLYSKIGEPYLSYSTAEGSPDQLLAGGGFSRLDRPVPAPVVPLESCAVMAVDWNFRPRFRTGLVNAWPLLDVPNRNILAGPELSFQIAGEPVVATPRDSYKGPSYQSPWLDPRLTPALSMAGNTVDFSGDAFPGFNSIELPPSTPYMLTSPLNAGVEGSVTPDTRFTWTGTPTPNSSWFVWMLGSSPRPDTAFIWVSCNGVDDGEFTIPAQTVALMKEAGFTGGAVISSWRSAAQVVAFRGDTVMYPRTSHAISHRSSPFPDIFGFSAQRQAASVQPHHLEELLHDWP